MNPDLVVKQNFYASKSIKPVFKKAKKSLLHVVPSSVTHGVFECPIVTYWVLFFSTATINYDVSWWHNFVSNLLGHIRICTSDEKLELTSLEWSFSFSKQFEGCGQTAFVSDNFKSHDCASFFLLREITHMDRDTCSVCFQFIVS